jgi:hypothetical protein
MPTTQDKTRREPKRSVDSDGARIGNRTQQLRTSVLGRVARRCPTPFGWVSDQRQRDVVRPIETSRQTSSQTTDSPDCGGLIRPLPDLRFVRDRARASGIHRTRGVPQGYRLTGCHAGRRRGRPRIRLIRLEGPVSARTAYRPRRYQASELRSPSTSASLSTTPGALGVTALRPVQSLGFRIEGP